MRSILTQDLCNEFQQQLIRHNYSEDSLVRYIDILTDFSLFGFGQYYSQRLGIDYLIYQFQCMKTRFFPKATPHTFWSPRILICIR